MITTTRRNASSGFTLIELVIVLGVTGLIFSGLWGLMTSGSSQLQAQSAAQQYRQVIEAVRKYVVSGSYTAGAAVQISDLTAVGVGLLPTNFSQTDAYGNTINIAVETINAANQQYRFIVYSDNARPLNDKAGAQVASIIGSEGGFVYSQLTDGCTTANPTQTACGSFNSFALPITAAPFSLAAGAGRIVALGYTIDTTSGTAPFLYRKSATNVPEQNTMQQNMFFNSGLSLTMNGSSITMGTNPTINSGGQELNMAGGVILNPAGIRGDGSTFIFTRLFMIPDDFQIVSDVIAITSGSSIDIDVGSSLNITGASAGQTVLSIFGRGVATTFEAGTFIYSSDSSMKENISPITNALDKLLQVRGFNYNWKSGHAKDMGVMAQDVQKVFPELVTQTGQGKMGVDYAKMIAPVIEAIRQLKTENEALKAKINRLEKQQGIMAH